MTEFTSTVTATKIYQITPNDSSDLPSQARALYIVTGGDIQFTPIKNDVPVTLSVPNYFVFPVQVKKVFASSTTADGIYAMI